MKRQLTIVFCVLVFFSCGVLPRAGKERDAAVSEVPRLADYPGNGAVYYFSEGLKEYVIRGNDSAAMRLYEQAVAADSSFGPAYYQMAEIMFKSDASRALDLSDMAVKSDSSNLTYQNQLGRALIVNSKYEEALDIYTTLMRRDSHNPVNYSMLAALYDYRGQPFTAISILDSAEYRMGRIEELSSYKRQLLINVRLYDKAIEESKAMIADYPYADENYVVLADLYAAMGRDSLALANYREALRIDSTNVNTLLSVAEFYKKKGNDRNYLALMKRVFESDAVDAQSKVDIFNELTVSVDYYRNNYFAINNLASTLLVRYPQDYSILDLYATHLIRSGEALAALDLFKSYRESNPDTLPPYYSILDIEAYLQRSDSVMKYSEMALKRFPDTLDLYLRKGFALDHLGRTDDALATYRQAFRRAGTDSLKSAVMGIIGDTYHKDGKHKKSFDSYRRALRLDPDNNVVLNNYAYYLSELDTDLDKALEMSSRANELSPANPTYLDTQAWIYYKLGRYEEAKKLMIQAVSLDRRGSEVLLLHYGDILYELGEYFMAKIYWKRALEKGYDAAGIEERMNWPAK